MENTANIDTAFELFGSDIALGNDFNALVAANGELILIEGCECAVQMVAVRLFIMLGSLFYDVEFGSLVLNWIREESTKTNRESLCVEIEQRVNVDPHVVQGSAFCSVLDWDHTGVELELKFNLIEQTHPENLVVWLNDNDGLLYMEILKSAKLTLPPKSIPLKN